jgi:ABC-type dipeptide/oligopeptide/nickel transport system permease component
VGRDHAQFGVLLERLIVVDTVFAIQGFGAGLGDLCSVAQNDLDIFDVNSAF